MSLWTDPPGIALFLLLCVSLAALFVLVAAVLMALYPTGVGRFFGARPLPFVGFRRLRELAVVWALLVCVGAGAALAGGYGWPWLPLVVSGWLVMEVGLVCLSLASLGWIARAARYPLALSWRGNALMNQVGTDPRVLEARRWIAFPFLVVPVAAWLAWRSAAWGWLALGLGFVAIAVGLLGVQVRRRLPR